MELTQIIHGFLSRNFNCNGYLYFYVQVKSGNLLLSSEQSLHS